MFKLAGILTIIFAATTAVAWGDVWWGTAVLGLGLLSGVVGIRWTRVRIPELEVGVVFHKQSQAFVRFLPPGQHWLNPFTQTVSHTIPTGSGSASGRCSGVQTNGGLSLDVEWSVSYSLDPDKIKAEARPKLARKLPQKAGAIVTKHVNNCLRHIIGEYSIEQLCQPGMQNRLERQVRHHTVSRLADLGFDLSRVMIGAIHMPAHVKRALEAAQERAVQTEMEARALARLHEVISQFSEADMQRLMELERIHALGQNGVTLMMPTAVSAAKPNGRASSPFAADPGIFSVPSVS